MIKFADTYLYITAPSEKSSSSHSKLTPKNNQMLKRSDASLKMKVAQEFKNGRFALHALPFSMATESANLESVVRGMNISSAVNRNASLSLPRDLKMSDVPSHS